MLEFEARVSKIIWTEDSYKDKKLEEFLDFQLGHCTRRLPNLREGQWIACFVSQHRINYLIGEMCVHLSVWQTLFWMNLIINKPV